MFFPSRIFIIIYYNYLLIILFCIFTTLFSCYYPLGKAGMREITMRDAVNDYLEASGANRPSIGGEETILAHRKIAANRLAIDCIYALSKEELSKVDRELEGIVGNLPLQHKGVKR